MKPIKFLPFYVIVFVLTFSGCATPGVNVTEYESARPDERDAEAAFADVRSSYDSQDYRGAVIKGESMLNRFSGFSRAPLVQQLIGSAYQRLNEYDLAANAYETFLKRYPNHRLTADIRRELGYSYLTTDKYFQAAECFFEFTRQNENYAESKKVENLLTSSIIPHLTADQIHQLLQRYPDTSTSDEMAFRSIQTIYNEGRWEVAEADIRDFKRTYPTSVHISEVDEMQRTLAGRIEHHRAITQGEPVSNSPANPQTTEFVPSTATGSKLGLIFPMSGQYSRFGASALKGAQMALEDYQTEAGVALNYSLKDSKSSAMEGLAVARDLIYTENIIGIVGPILSDAVSAVASVAQPAGVPLITPTATDREVAALGDHIFQLNSPLADLGRAMAKYAMEELNLTRFAILHPQTSYGTEMANGFSGYVVEAGGDLLETIPYSSGKADFQDEVRILRNYAPGGKKVAPGEQAQTGQSPFGLFIPAEVGDILLIAPQLKHYNIDVQLLGGNGWNSERLLKTEARSVEGAYFVDTYYDSGYFAAIQQFNERFFKKYQQNPDKVSALTYDATRLFLNGIRKGADSPQALYQQITQISRYEGVTGYITLSPEKRLRKHPQVFQITGGMIKETFWMGF